jgi:hypothetical protein
VKFILYYYLSIVLSTVNIFFIANDISSVNDLISNKITVNEAEIAMQKFEKFETFITSLSLFIIIPFFFFIPLWIYRTTNNAKYLGAENMQFSGGFLSSILYFIPILNLFLPFMAMSELYKISVNLIEWKTIKTDKILKIWWLAWIVNIYLILKILVVNAKEETDALVLEYYNLSFVSEIAYIFLAFSFLKIITIITKNQIVQYDNMTIMVENER